MSELEDIVSTWQFRTVMGGAVIAGVGIAVCLLGSYIGNGTVCTAGRINLYLGDTVGFVGIAAGVLTLGWKWLERKSSANR